MADELGGDWYLMTTEEYKELRNQRDELLAVCEKARTLFSFLMTRSNTENPYSEAIEPILSELQAAIAKAKGGA